MKMLLVGLLVLLEGCRVVDRLIEDPYKHYHDERISYKKRYHVEGQLSFLYPKYLNGYRVVVYDSVLKTSFSNKDGVEIYIKVGLGLNDLEPSPEAYFYKKKKKIDDKNGRIKELYRGTLEGRWQEVNTPEYVRKEAADILKKVKRSEEEALVSNFFKTHLQYDRDRYAGIPEDTYEEYMLSGVKCAIRTFNDRINAPVAQYAIKVGGGVEIRKALNCYVSDIKEFIIEVWLRSPPGVDALPDQILIDLIKTIKIDKNLPESFSTHREWLRSQETL